MLQFKLKQNILIKPLQRVSHIAERRQTMAISAHILLSIEEERIVLAGTDQDVLAEAYIPIQKGEFKQGKLVLSGHKLLEICRNLPSDAEIQFSEVDHRCLVASGQSQFSLATLPPEDFPGFSEDVDHASENLEIRADVFLKLIQSSVFAVAQKDVRYYLNGIWLELNKNQLKMVGADGHRMALMSFEKFSAQNPLSVIVPRKTALELSRLLSALPEEELIKLSINQHHIRVEGVEFKLISRLIEGRVPSYEGTIPKESKQFFYVDKDLLKQALIRVSILSNEKISGVKMLLKQGALCLEAKNYEKEEAREVLTVEYNKPETDICFNVSYLLDVLSVLDSSQVKITLFGPKKAFLVEEGEEQTRLGLTSLFVIMPMYL
jgi:DNA polymerase III subunit beta